MCCSTYVPARATAAEVEAALEGLEPTGDLTVTRTENDDNGYDWQVCLPHVGGDFTFIACLMYDLLQYYMRFLIYSSASFVLFRAIQLFTFTDHLKYVLN